MNSIFLLLIVLGSLQPSWQDAARTHSPQFLYLQKLREELNEFEQPIVKGPKLGGSLLVTSIEASALEGPGNTTEGLDIQSGHIYTLDFSIPSQEEAPSIIQSAELWLFPKQFFQPQVRFVELVLLVKVQLEHASNPRQEVIAIVWDTSSDCLMVNMTSLSRKVSRNIEKNHLKIANITITIDIVDIAQITEIPAEQKETEEYLIDRCNSLSAKEVKTPFLALEYFSRKTKKPDFRERRTVFQARAEKTNASCVTVPMMVNMTKLFGDSIIYPKMLDIGDCLGTCKVEDNGKVYSNHATILERNRPLNGDKPSRSVSCVPTVYKPIPVLIKHPNILIIVLFDETIVTECGCR